MVGYPVSGVCGGSVLGIGGRVDFSSALGHMCVGAATDGLVRFMRLLTCSVFVLVRGLLKT